MPTRAESLDLSSLSVAARREVKDFYEFIIARRGHMKRKPTARTLPAAFETPIKVKEYLKVSRDEIYDEI